MALGIKKSDAYVCRSAPTALPRQRHRICSLSSNHLILAMVSTKGTLSSPSLMGSLDKETQKTRRRNPFILPPALNPLTTTSPPFHPQVSPWPLSCLVSFHSYTTMPESAEPATSTLAAIRSPQTISVEASRSNSFRQAPLLARNCVQPRAPSPPGRLTRKRAATLTAERSNLSQSIGDLAITAVRATALPQTDVIREQVCLCQPDPKIPRPRNGIQYLVPFDIDT